MGKLTEIQAELNAPKKQFNKFGNYAYRSCEDIVEAVKPLLKKHNADLFLSDEIEVKGDRYYVKATATFKCGDEVVVATASARESETRKGMDDSQITGAASSYARKYALNGLFLIDDNKDADSNEARYESEGRAKSAPAQSVSEEQKEEMKKWKDGTFTKEELDKFKADWGKPGLAERFNKMKAEYEKRKAETPSAEAEKGASDAFDLY